MVLRDRPFVPFPPNLVPVRIVERLNRFTVRVRVDVSAADFGRAWGSADSADSRGSIMDLHLPNSGRMQELLTPKTQGLATMDGGGERKTHGTLLLVYYADRWVSVDARMPNRLLEACVSTNYLAAFRGYDTWRSEVRWAKGRIDFRLSGPQRPDLLVETKSCNLVEDGVALFPDAPTQRGARHLRELAEAVREGLRAAVVWFVQRDDALRLAPHRHADPEFAEAVDDARAAGVEMLAYRCRVSPLGVEVLDSIPVVRDRDDLSHVKSESVNR